MHQTYRRRNSFFFGIFRVVINYFIRRNSRGRHGWRALSKTVDNGVSCSANIVLLHRHKVWSRLLLPCMQRVVSVEVYVFWGVLKGRQCNSLYVFYSELDNQV